jgi:hypothetical protein
VTDEEDRTEALHVLARDQSVDTESVATTLPNPPEIQARLYEVMPYPRVPRYFRRHWW